ncbi:MAG: hypothetical protein QOE84_1261, partial [Actinomycetota bacterium]|nr:hypothetical protein [Actinomycetota bacterium]
GLFLEISVNISARQLDAATLYDDVALALQSSGLDPRFLVLEITESALMRDPASAALTLRKIKTLGVRIAIDDFGTGYSSLAYLRQFPVDTLKIDRSFVTQATDSADGEALIDSLVHLGKSLGIKTLAEGIETAAELQQVQRAGCNGGQGYFFGRPMDAQSVRSFLQTATSSPATTL